MEIFGDFIFLGGGGGYEIANKIQVFKIPSLQQNSAAILLKDLVHEESTNKDVANFMTLDRNVRNNPKNPFNFRAIQYSPFVKMKMLYYTILKFQLEN